MKWYINFDIFIDELSGICYYIIYNQSHDRKMAFNNI